MNRIPGGLHPNRHWPLSGPRIFESSGPRKPLRIVHSVCPRPSVKGNDCGGSAVRPPPCRTLPRRGPRCQDTPIPLASHVILPHLLSCFFFSLPLLLPSPFPRPPRARPQSQPTVTVMQLAGSRPPPGPPQGGFVPLHKFGSTPEKEETLRPRPPPPGRILPLAVLFRKTIKWLVPYLPAAPPARSALPFLYDGGPT